MFPGKREESLQVEGDRMATVQVAIMVRNLEVAGRVITVSTPIWTSTGPIQGEQSK